MQPIRARIALALGALVAASAAGFLTAGTAQSSTGLFVWTGKHGSHQVPFPADDKCFKAPGGKAAQNYTAADAYLYTDAKCTVGKDADSVPPGKSSAVPFESFRVPAAAN